VALVLHQRHCAATQPALNGLPERDLAKITRDRSRRCGATSGRASCSASTRVQVDLDIPGKSERIIGRSFFEITSEERRWPNVTRN